MKFAWESISVRLRNLSWRFAAEFATFWPDRPLPLALLTARGPSALCLVLALLASACTDRPEDIAYVTQGEDVTHRHVTAVQVRCLVDGYVLVQTELPGRVVDLRCVRTVPPPTAGGAR